MSVLLPSEVCEIVSRHKERLAEIFPQEKFDVILFGSYARGDAQDGSDIDVMFLVNAFRQTIQQKQWQIGEAAAEILLESGVAGSPIVENRAYYHANADLLPLAVIRSLGAGIQTPAVNAVIAQLVPEDQIMRYNGINATLQSVAQFAAPAVDEQELTRNFFLYLFLMLIYGAAITMVQTSTTTMIQENADEAMQGRVFGLMGALYSGCLPIGMIIFGPMADLIPLPFILIGSGFALVLPGTTLCRKT